MASMRLSTRRATKKPPASPEHHHERDRPAAGVHDDVVEPLALLEIAADQQAKAAGQLDHPHQRVVLGVVLLADPAIG